MANSKIVMVRKGRPSTRFFPPIERSFKQTRGSSAFAEDDENGMSHLRFPARK